MTLPILADEIAQIGPKAHVCDCRFVIDPFLDWEAFEEDETFAVDEILTDTFKIF